jgi:hypothetical protein
MDLLFPSLFVSCALVLSSLMAVLFSVCDGLRFLLVLLAGAWQSVYELARDRSVRVGLELPCEVEA